MYYVLHGHGHGHKRGHIKVAYLNTKNYPKGEK